MKWLNENRSTFLTMLGAGGMVASTFLAVKETPKAIAEAYDAQLDKGHNSLTRFEMLKAKLPCYIPAIAAGTGGLICLMGASILSRKQQASLRTGYAALVAAFESYREKIRAFIGADADRSAMEAVNREKYDLSEGRPPWDEEQSFCLEIEGCEKIGCFDRTMKEIEGAKYEVNHMFALFGTVSVNELLGAFRLLKVEGGDDMGWDSIVCETRYDCRWIDFAENWRETDDGLTVCSIYTPIPPEPFREQARGF